MLGDNCDNPDKPVLLKNILGKAVSMKKDGRQVSLEVKTSDKIQLKLFPVKRVYRSVKHKIKTVLVK